MSRKERIELYLINSLSPSFLKVEDESAQHHVPTGAETHFKVTLVTEQFSNCSRVARHRMVNQLLNSEFGTGLHALSMHLFTPDEWSERSLAVLTSPNCKDGYKNK